MDPTIAKIEEHSEVRPHLAVGFVTTSASNGRGSLSQKAH